MSATGDRVRRGERGATLMEMLVVLGVLALVTGLAFPALRRPYARLSAQAAGYSVLADLRTARAEARRTGRPVGFAVSPDGALYRYGDRSKRLPAAVRLAAGAPIVFLPDGSSSGGRLEVRSGASRAALQVDRASGLVVQAPS